MHFVKGELTTSHHWLRFSQQHLSPGRYNSPEAAVPPGRGDLLVWPSSCSWASCTVPWQPLPCYTGLLGSWNASPGARGAASLRVLSESIRTCCKDHALRAASKSQSWGGDQSRAAVAQSHKKSSKLSSCSFPNGTSSLSHKIYPCTEVEVPFGQSLYEEVKTSRISPCQEHKLLFRLFCRI